MAIVVEERKITIEQVVGQEHPTVLVSMRLRLPDGTSKDYQLTRMDLIITPEDSATFGLFLAGIFAQAQSKFLTDYVIE